jgi:hypothetical protein
MNKISTRGKVMKTSMPIAVCGSLLSLLLLLTSSAYGQLPELQSGQEEVVLKVENMT